jgi:hypothetical protein
MNTKNAAPVIFTVSLVVLIGGGAGTAAWGGPGPLRDDGGATVVGFARGHVVVKDDLSPIHGSADILSAATTRTPQTVQGFSNEALRELHSSAPAPQSVPEFSNEALRELHSSAPAPQTANGFTAEVMRELHSQGVAPQSARELSTEVRRELHSGSVAPRTTAAQAQGQRLSEYAEALAASSGPTAAQMQGERLSAYAEALAGATPTSESVDDDLSPTAGPR